MEHELLQRYPLPTWYPNVVAFYAVELPKDILMQEDRPWPKALCLLSKHSKYEFPVLLGLFDCFGEKPVWLQTAKGVTWLLAHLHGRAEAAEALARVQAKALTRLQRVIDRIAIDLRCGVDGSGLDNLNCQEILEAIGDNGIVVSR